MKALCIKSKALTFYAQSQQWSYTAPFLHPLDNTLFMQTVLGSTRKSNVACVHVMQYVEREH